MFVYDADLLLYTQGHFHTQNDTIAGHLSLMGVLLYTLRLCDLLDYAINSNRDMQQSQKIKIID